MTLPPRSLRWRGSKLSLQTFRRLTGQGPELPLCPALSRHSGLCHLERMFPKTLSGLCETQAWMRKSPHPLRKPAEGKNRVSQRRWPRLKNAWSPTLKPTWPRRFWCSHPNLSSRSPPWPIGVKAGSYLQPLDAIAHASVERQGEEQSLTDLRPRPHRRARPRLPGVAPCRNRAKVGRLQATTAGPGRTPPAVRKSGAAG